MTLRAVCTAIALVGALGITGCASGQLPGNGGNVDARPGSHPDASHFQFPDASPFLPDAHPAGTPDAVPVGTPDAPPVVIPDAAPGIPSDGGVAGGCNGPGTCAPGNCCFDLGTPPGLCIMGSPVPGLCE